MIRLDDLSRSHVQAAIDEWIIGKFAERDRAILATRLIDGLTYEQIAERHQEKYPLSVDQIKRIIYKRETQLYKHL